MNHTVMTPEVAAKIGRAINDIAVSGIMCRSATKDADEAAAEKNWSRANECHDKWNRWWNMGVDAHEVLKGLGIPVSVPKRVAEK